MKKILLSLMVALTLVGCATPSNVPENVQGVFCTSVRTLTTTVTTVFANKEVGKLTASPECAITIKTE